MADLNCINCSAWSCVEDHTSGDIVCTECGAVQSERMVDEGAETRAFFDDDPHSHGMNKQGNRIGMGTFIYASHTDLSLDFRLNKHDKKERQFLRDMEREIERILYGLYQGSAEGKLAKGRAKEICEILYDIQVQEKRGLLPMHRGPSATREHQDATPMIPVLRRSSRLQLASRPVGGSDGNSDGNSAGNNDGNSDESDEGDASGGETDEESLGESDAEYEEKPTTKTKQRGTTARAKHGAKRTIVAYCLLRSFEEYHLNGFTIADINKFFAANEKVMLRAIIRFEKKMGKYITEIPD